MNKDRIWLAIALVGVLAAAFLRILLIHVPLERDEGVYAYVGDRILAGEMPYVDAIESKPPGIFLVYAAVLAFGRAVPFIRAVLLLWSTGTALLFFVLVRRLYGIRTAGVATAVLALSLTAPVYFGYSLKTEPMMIAFILAAFLVLAKNLSGDSFRADLAAGALLGIAVMFKPVALTEGLPVLVLIALSPGLWAKKLVRLSAVGLGVFLVFIGVYGFFAAFGAGSDYLFWAFGYNISYSSDLTATDRIGTFLYQIRARGMIVREWPVWILAAVAVANSFRGPSDRALALFAPAWLVSAFIGVSASGRYTPHYFIQLLPPLSLLCGLGVNVLLKKIESVKADREFKHAFAVVLLGVVLIYPTISQARLYLAGPQLSRILYGVNPFMEGETIGDYLAARTGPDDPIFICGTEPQFLVHAKRKSATRFATLYPLGSLHSDAQRWQEEVFEEVLQANPSYIVMVHITSSMYLDMRAPKYLPSQTLELLEKHYVREAALVAITARKTQFVAGDLSEMPKDPAILTIYRKADKSPAD